MGGRKPVGPVLASSLSVHNARADVFIFVEEPVDFAVCFSFVVLKVKSVTSYLLCNTNLL